MLYGSGNSNRGSVSTERGWDRVEDGRGLQKGGDMCIPMADSFGEGNGTPLQYSCLENPMDGGAW